MNSPATKHIGLLLSLLIVSGIFVAFSVSAQTTPLPPAPTPPVAPLPPVVPANIQAMIEQLNHIQALMSQIQGSFAQPPVPTTPTPPAPPPPNAPQTPVIPNQSLNDQLQVVKDQVRAVQDKMNALITPGTPTSPLMPIFTHTLRYGMGNDIDVVSLQNKLIHEGVYNGPVTGYFGKLTLDGVKGFQRKYRIADTGLVGPLTREKLNQLGE